MSRGWLAVAALLGALSPFPKAPVPKAPVPLAPDIAAQSGPEPIRRRAPDRRRPNPQRYFGGRSGRRLTRLLRRQAGQEP